NLTRAIKAADGPMESLVAEVQVCEARKQALMEARAGLAQAEALARVDLTGIEGQLRARLDDWRGFLLGECSAARQILRKLIPERLVFTPHTENGERYYEFAGVGRLEPVLDGLIPLTATRPGGAPGHVRQDWWPQRDSNPCFSHDHVFAIVFGS